MSLSVTTVDFLVVVVILISTGYAIWRGFLWETLTIFAWVAAVFASLYLGPAIVPLAESMIATHWLARLVGFAAVFLAVLIPLAFMTHRFSQTVKNSPIGPFDRALGAAFGVIRGLVIVGLVYIAFTWFVPVPRQPDWLTGAQMLPIIQRTDEVLLTLVPPQDHPDFPLSPRGSAHGSHDLVGDLIRRNEWADRAAPSTLEQGESVHHKSAPKPKKRYGARDRQALDRLIETTGNGK